MAAKPTKIVVNCATGESQTIELTDAEIAQREADAAAYAEQKAAEDAAAEAKAALKESARFKLIAGTPLSAEEASVLII